jgi:CxxC motif-containing protein (DUF1111 family)
MRGTKVPPRDTVLATTTDVQAGQLLFAQIGCATCHVHSIVTAPSGTVLNGGMWVVPDALGNKLIHPYSDFLLHDVGTGDGIVQGGPVDTINKLRTTPLWGLRTKTRFMHDLKSLSLADAINRHRDEARGVVDNFQEDLTPAQQHPVITFLNSLQGSGRQSSARPVVGWWSLVVGKIPRGIGPSNPTAPVARM